MTKEDKELWLDLYSYADLAYDLKPWEYVSETNLLSFIDDKNDIWYASVLGNAKKFYGIIFIHGKDINKYLEIYNNNYSFIQSFNYQIGLMISYVNKKDLQDDELHHLKELGISFNELAIKFKKFESGYLPHMINIEDVEKLSYLLNNFMVIFKHLENKEVLPPKDNEMLTRYYSIPDKAYNTANIEFFKLDDEYRNVSFDEINLFSKRNPIELEFDFINYLPIAIGTNYENGKYKLNKFFALADATHNKMLKIEIIDSNKYLDEDEYNKAMINNLIDFINDNFIPKRIIVRDNYTYNLLKDFNKLTNLEVKIDKIRVIDVFIDSFMKGRK